MTLSPKQLAYLRLLRAPAVFTVLADILAAHVLATGGHVQGSILALTAAASSALYLAGMVLNDCFDLLEDSRERPHRPLPSRAIAPASAWRLGWLLLAGGVAVASLAGSRPLLLALLLAGTIVLYNGKLKDTPLGGPTMGACRYLNWLLGLAVGPLTGHSLLLGLPVFIYVGSLTWLSRVETSARSRLPLGACAGGMVLTLGVLIVFNRSGLLPAAWVLAPASVALAIVLWRLLKTYRDFAPPSIQRSVGMLIMGIIPLDALLAGAGGFLWAGLTILALLLPGWLLKRRLEVT